MPLSIGTEFSQAIVATLGRFAAANSLPQLDWRLVRYPEAMIIEGMPRNEGDAGGCSRWAKALDMEEYGFVNERGVRSWHLNDATWAIEIRDSPRAS